jgi:hypothetical protein
MLIITNNISVTSHRTVASPIKVTRNGVLGKFKTAISCSAAAPQFSGSIKERHKDNSWQRNWFIHLWKHIGVAFILGVRCTCSTPGEDTVAVLDSILFYPTSHLPLFFLISPFSSVINFLFL